jgi:hypothetical protein
VFRRLFPLVSFRWCGFGRGRRRRRGGLTRASKQRGIAATARPPPRPR